MGASHGADAAGRPLDLIGQRLDARPAPGGVGITFRRKDDSSMAKAPHDGVYLRNGNRFRIRKGDDLPAGAAMADTPPAEKPAKAEPDAPENKAEQPPAKKAAKKD